MLPKLTRGTLAEQVTERLLEFIDAQHLKAGELLPSETSLAASFGVSRPVIREALKNLEGKGVIEIVNGKGALVRAIDCDPLRLFFQRAIQMESCAIRELLEVRRGIEINAAMLAAHRRTEQDLQAIQLVVDAMRENVLCLDQYARLDFEFHLSIAKASHNIMLVYLVESLRDALRTSITASLQSRWTDQGVTSVQQNHEMLYQTLVSGHPDEASRAMALHFDEAISAISNLKS